MAGGADPHLVRLTAATLALAESLEHFGAQIFGAGDRAAGGRLVAGGLGGAVGLGAGHDLTGQGFADTHLEAGFSDGGLLRTMAIRAAGAGTATAGATGGAHLALQFTHLLSQFPTAHVGVALAGDGGGGTVGGGVGRFTALREGLAAGEHQGPAGVVLGGAFRGG